MKASIKDFEIMAPVGSRESLAGRCGFYLLRN